MHRNECAHYLKTYITSYKFHAKSPDYVFRIGFTPQRCWGIKGMTLMEHVYLRCALLPVDMRYMYNIVVQWCLCCYCVLMWVTFSYDTLVRFCHDTCKPVTVSLYAVGNFFFVGQRGEGEQGRKGSGGWGGESLDWPSIKIKKMCNILDDIMHISTIVWPIICL